MTFTDRFSDLATVYAQARPSYPSEAVAILIEGLGDPQTLSVVDLGAGTGISSRLIADCGPHVLAIPGTTSIAHLQENACAPAAAPPETLMQRLDDLFGPAALAGDRYNTATQAEIDTECFEPASPAP